MPAPSVGCRVVICDDQSMFREVLRTVLELEEGFEIVGEGCNGAEAIKLAGSLGPDVMLLDVAMPVMDGLEALPQIRAAAPDTGVVVLTGLSSPEIRRRALAAGAALVVEKGTDLEALTRAVREVCAD
jgi:DNA-binding NarL/FixJ family response regulator